jgi:hypothetical protein
MLMEAITGRHENNHGPSAIVRAAEALPRRPNLIGPRLIHASTANKSTEVIVYR